MFIRTIFKTFAVISAFSFTPYLIADDSKQDDNTIVITANRTSQNINNTLAAVEVITREDIERMQPESITDLLNNIAGFDFAYSGGAGQTSSLFTRGSSSDHTLVLVDGVRVGSATLGNKSFATIAVDQIERVEVVKGPRASLWGSDAIGGVIQIFTRRLNDGEFSVAATVGSDDYLNTNFSAGFGNSEIKNTVTVSFAESDGFDAFDDSSDSFADSEPDNDGYQKISAAIRGDYTLSDNTNLDWVFQYDEGNNSFDNAYGDNENEYNNHLWNIRYTYTLDKLLTEFSVKQSRDKAISFNSRDDVRAESLFETRRNQINVLTQYTFEQGISLTAGAEHYKDDVGRSSTSYPVTERTSDAIFVSSLLNMNDFLGEFSVRYDDIESVGSDKTFNFSAGYKILDNVTIAASRAKGFKAPTFNDLYFPGFGNDELVSEISYNNEILVRAHWNNHSLLLVNFDNQVDRLITFLFDPVTFAFLPFNIDKANLKGHEVVYQYRQGALSHKFTASFVDAIDQSIDSLTGLAKNEQLLRRAKEHYGYEMVAELGDFSFFTQFNYIGRRRDNDFSTFPATPVYLKSHIAVNLGANYQATEQLSFSFKIKDYTDEAQSTVFNYNAPGQQVSVSVQYRNF